MDVGDITLLFTVWMNASAAASVLLFQVTDDEFLRLQALYMARIEELELKVLFNSFMVITVSYYFWSIELRFVIVTEKVLFSQWKIW